MAVQNPPVLSRRAALAGLAAPAALSLAAVRPAGARAAPAATEPPPFRRFALGRLTITVVSDGGAMVDGPWPIVGEDRPPEEVERLMIENLLPPKRFWPGFSPIVVDDGTTRTLIDAGNGADGFIPRPAGGRLVENLRAAGYEPSDIDLVALTHGHVDHIGGVMEAGAPAFPKARYAMGAAEHAFWSEPARLGAAEGSNELKSARLFVRTFPALADRTTLLKPGQEAAPGITALAAFGHTPGHLAFHIESQGRRLLVWGDCAHHDVASLAHPEWSAFFDMDKEQGKATRARIYDMAATERLPVLGYHTSFPSIGFVARSGAGFRWIRETYQLAE
ncbi:MBL fold metallo-hydrolase [Chelatococcus sambhunathii]|uniref:MBL fold metallo-hydrolase n=1 Tax=Chelatococcus sambhunathii TaxID=363953 RepID=A0ABU1DG47_9HYPH|nr:MBL fold metallo-hydrolase [Chelatococcus sambhunathii]MDR4307074.1 MBL fold metallo-hydrolase [Chelatococcus sambhunathii]